MVTVYSVKSANNRLSPFPTAFAQNSEKTVGDRLANLRPWPRGTSGNPGGRPRKKPISEELERLLEQEAPNANGQSWAVAIAQALLHEARKGDVRAISELANRVEGKPLQPLDVKGDGLGSLAERLERARKRALAQKSNQEIEAKIRELQQELGSRRATEPNRDV